MPHMVAQEHMGYVDALRYGTTRSDVTIAAALAAIGSTQTTLILSLAGDGIWTIGSNLTIPSNIILWIPPGVVVNIATGITLTVNGPFVNFASTWQTGPGTATFTLPIGVFVGFSRVVTTSFQIEVPAGSTAAALVAGRTLGTGGANAGKQLLFYPSVPSGIGAGNLELQFMQPPQTGSSIWSVGINTLNQWYVARPSGYARICVDEPGVGLSNGVAGVTPSHVLHLTIDDAFKPTTLWSVPSSDEVKDVHGDYHEGLDLLRRLPTPKVFVYTGAADTPSDGEEQIGYMASEMQTAMPQWLKPYKAKLHPDDAEPITLQALNLSPLLPTIVNAIHQLESRLAAVEGR